MAADVRAGLIVWEANMPLLEIKKDLTRGQLRLFSGILFPAFCGLLGWVLYRCTQSLPLSVGIWGLGGTVLVLGLIAPSCARPIYLGWMYAAYPIGWVVFHLAVGIVYYFVLTPIGVALRLGGYDPLARRFDPKAETYWTRRRASTEKRRYFRQF